METTCETAECNICGKQATVKEEFCQHLCPEGILREYPVEKENASLNIKVGSTAKACSINKGLTFTGYALVFDPADKGADVTRIAAQKKETKEDVLSKLSGVVEKLVESVKSLTTSEIKPEAVDQVKARVSRGLIAELLRKTVTRELVAHNVPETAVEDTAKQIVDEIVDSAIADAKVVAAKSVEKVASTEVVPPAETVTDLKSTESATPASEEQVAKTLEVIKVSVKKEASVFISALEMQFTPAEKLAEAKWSLFDKKNNVS